MKKHSRTCSGFSLVEVALALAIAAFCLLTLMALVPVGIQGYQQAGTQAAMVNLATMVERDLETTPTTGTCTSARFAIPIPSAGGTATPSTSPVTFYTDISGVQTPLGIGVNATSASIYRISLFFTPPATAGQRTATMARILITFPAGADSSFSAVPSKYTNMFQTTVALNRN